MTDQRLVPPLVLAPRAHIEQGGGGDLWLISVELWPQKVVLCCHLLGVEQRPGQPQAGTGLVWEVLVGSTALTWLSTLSGGTGTESRIDWILSAPTPLDYGEELPLRWSGPDASSGSLVLPIST